MDSFPNSISNNLVNIVSAYFVEGEYIIVRKKKVIVRTFSSFISYPLLQNFVSCCQYQLLKFKSWSLSPMSAWHNTEECGETYIQFRRDFLIFNGNDYIPSWEYH